MKNKIPGRDKFSIFTCDVKKVGKVIKRNLKDPNVSDS